MDLLRFNFLKDPRILPLEKLNLPRTYEGINYFSNPQDTIHHDFFIFLHLMGENPLDIDPHKPPSSETQI